MYILNLNIYFNIKDDALIKKLSSVKIPDNTNAEFLSVPDIDGFAMPDKKDIAVISDDKAAVEKLTALKAEHLDIVYIGNAEDISASLNNVSDIWAAGESEDSYLWRMDKLISNIRNRFDAWGYAELLDDAISISPDMMWFKREDGIHTFVNPAFCDTVDKTREDVTGKDHFYIWDVTRDETGGDNDCSESERQVIAAGEMLTFEEAVLSKGDMKQLTVYKAPVYDWHGNVWGTVGLGHDVTNFSNMGIELDILVDSLPFPVGIFDRDYKVVKLNEKAEDLIKLTGADERDFYYPQWKHENYEPVSEEKYDKATNSTSRDVMIDVSGDPRIYAVSEQGILDYFQNVSGYFVTMRDITFQKTYEKSILDAANTDALTGLFNRRYFYEYLNKNKERKITLLYLDLDNFKAINDTYGHQRGDEVLKKTATFIRTYFPGCEAARLGGDEYAVLITDNALSEEEIADASERFGSAVRRIFRADGPYVTVSIGRADSEGLSADDDIDDFIHIADKAMYDVKREHHSGR